MAIIACPECSKSVSNAAASCPHCGHPLSSQPTPRTGPPPTLMISLAVLALILVGGAALFMSKQQAPTDSAASVTSSSDAASTPPAQNSPAPEQAETAGARSTVPATSACNPELGPKEQFGLEAYSGPANLVCEAVPAIKAVFCKPGATACKILDMHVYQDYAYFDWQQGDPGGFAFAQKVAGQWKIIKTGGGGILPHHANYWGIPQEIGDFIIPIPFNGYSGPLDAASLADYSAWELSVIRNSIYAYHGRSFTTPRLQAFFENQPWYKPNPNYNDSMLSATEKANVEIVVKLEKQKGFL